MWFKDEKMANRFKLGASVLWVVTVILAVLLYIGSSYEIENTDRIFVFVILIPLVAQAIALTIQFKSYSQGIFISDYELILPVVRQHKIDATKLKKVEIIDKSGESSGKHLLKFHVEGKLSPYTVIFSSSNIRQEIIETLQGFFKQLPIEDKRRRKKKTDLDHFT